jgi:hypothetical protein
MKLRKRQPVHLRDSDTLWKDLKHAAYFPFYVVVFVMACLAGPDWSDYHWTGKLMAIGFVLFLGFAVSRGICELVDELKKRNHGNSNM